MGYVIHIAVALGALLLGELGWGAERSRPLAVAALACVPHLLAVLARRAALRGRLRTSLLLEARIGQSAPLCYLAALFLAGWQAEVTRWTGVPERVITWPHPALLLDLLPWLAYELLAIDAQARVRDGARSDGQRLLQARLLLSGLAPFGIYLALSFAFGASEVVRANLELVPAWQLAYAAGLLVLTGAAFPSLVRRTWDTRPLPPGRERDLLQGIAARTGFRCRELLCWNTGGRQINAAIVGVTPGTRVVLFTDALLAHLSPRELGAVFAHEVGHALSRHVLAFGAWVAGFLLWTDALLLWTAPLGAVLGPIAALVPVALLLVLLRNLSRRFELEADLCGLEITGDPAALVGALEMAGGPHARRQRSWRHFSVAERSEFLLRAALDPAVGRRLRRGLARWKIAGAVLFALGLAFQGTSVWQSLPQDQVRVDLRLGRYRAAEQRLVAVREPDAELAALAARGAEVERRVGPTDSGGLAALAREAFARRGLEEGLELLDLAGLRGSRECEAAAEALRLRAEGREGPARELLESDAPAWIDALAPWIGPAS